MFKAVSVAFSTQEKITRFSKKIPHSLSNILITSSKLALSCPTKHCLSD